jgi:hypothetical protein
MSTILAASGPDVRFPYPAFKDSAALRVPKDRADFHFATLEQDAKVGGCQGFCGAGQPRLCCVSDWFSVLGMEEKGQWVASRV